MSDWIKGPWHYQEGSDAYTHIVRAGDEFVCQLLQDTSGKSEARAKLIAAAPDMAEALEECLREHGGFTIKGECERKARSALAKAKGQQG